MNSKMIELGITNHVFITNVLFVLWGPKLFLINDKHFFLLILCYW